MTNFRTDSPASVVAGFAVLVSDPAFSFELEALRVVVVTGIVVVVGTVVAVGTVVVAGTAVIAGNVVVVGTAVITHPWLAIGLVFVSDSSLPFELGMMVLMVSAVVISRFNAGVTSPFLDPVV